MYRAYFNLKASPFAITPDPRFLYLSPRHKEALAHLVHGIQSGGFVQLTGDVGTGKTLLCRHLLRQLPAWVEAAALPYPKLTPHELVLSVLEAFRIPPPNAQSPRALVDALHRHLLRACAQNRRCILIVDEAQQLPPETLEQIRLLTNLETTRHKLLQVILIGQQELCTLIKRHDLRQLDQRITARYHLSPLSLKETSAYIHHRLKVAGRGDALFTPAARHLIHIEAQGVPRLINAICDRALLGAYARDKARVGLWMARRAAREVLG